MPSYSKTTIVGHLGNKPELREAAGKAVCNFSVAVNGRKKDAPPTWFKVTAWEKLAENCAQYLDKGRAVLVDGEITLDTWTDKKTGEVKSGIALRASSVTFLSEPTAGGRASAKPAGGGGGDDFGPPPDDDIPF